MYQYLRREAQDSPVWMIFYIILAIGGGVYAFTEVHGSLYKTLAFILASLLSFIGAVLGGYIRRFSLPSRVHGSDMWDLLVKKVGLYITPPLLGCFMGAFIAVSIFK